MFTINAHTITFPGGYCTIIEDEGVFHVRQVASLMHRFESREEVHRFFEGHASQDVVAAAINGVCDETDIGDKEKGSDELWELMEPKIKAA